MFSFFRPELNHNGIFQKHHIVVFAILTSNRLNHGPRVHAVLDQFDGDALYPLNNGPCKPLVDLDKRSSGWIATRTLVQPTTRAARKGAAGFRRRNAVRVQGAGQPELEWNRTSQE
jgi:hypothetical protein